jgi:hypothetical protein
MPIIKTARNHVYTYEPQPGHDVFVEILIGPGGDSRLYRQLLIQPIDQWQAAVDWAVGIADQMAHPVYVAAVGAPCFIRQHGDQVQREFDNLSDQQRDALRQNIVNTCAAAMRDCPDDDVRADAFEVLAKLGVVSNDQ